MKIALFVLSILVVILGSSNLAFAEDYEITIPSGASDPGAPYFWSEKSTGVTTGEITIFPRDSVTWHNGDTAFHTITSVSASSIETGDFEEDGVFDSGFFTAGESYTRQFDELGNYYYYCSLHPWMNGVVHVVKNPGSVQSVDRVASGFTDDGLGFEVKYILDTNLSNTVDVDPDERTLTFVISGDTENEQITFVLPPELIENPTNVWVDGNVADFQTEETATGTKLIIPIEPYSKEIKIMGAYVIPEFGSIVMFILVISIVSVVIFTKRFNFALR